MRDNISIIESIETAGSTRRARRLHLSTGETRTTSAAALRLVGLEAGDRFDATLLSSAEGKAASDRAYRALGVRDHSTTEIARKLREDGYPEDIVSSTIERLTELAFLDDMRFAVSWAENRAASGHGPRRIAQELAQRGVERRIVDDALSNIATDDVATARAALHGRKAHTKSDAERLIRRLVSRGYSYDTARRAVVDSDDDLRED